MTGTEPLGSPRLRGAVGSDVLLVTHRPPGPQCEQEEGVRGGLPAREVSVSPQRLRCRQDLLMLAMGSGGSIRLKHPWQKGRVPPKAQV